MKSGFVLGSVRAVLLGGAIAAAAGGYAFAQGAADPAAEMATLMADGATKYRTTCAGCHGAEGLGGAGPSLVTSTVITRASGIINQILQGNPERGMPPFASLSNHDIAAISTFVRNSWGNSYGVVTEANVATVRP